MKKLLLLIIYFVSCFLSVAQAEDSEVLLQSIHFENTRLVLLFNKQPGKYKVFSLAHPDRIVIDLENTRLKTNVSHVQSLPLFINSLRNGFPTPTTLRLVIDMKESVPFKHQAFLQENNPAIAIDMGKMVATKNSVAKTVATLPTVKSVTTKNFIAQSNTATTTVTPKKTIIIVIDPGHGGRDCGAKGMSGTCEKDVVLAISKQLYELINQQPNRRAVLTRRGDYFVPLRGRLQSARKGKADLFIAIHADSYFNTTASGASVYALSPNGATKEAVRWIAQRENYSELGGVDFRELSDQSYLLRSVLVDLAQTATITDSLRLGNTLLDSLNDVTRLHYARVEQAPFVVLKSPDIPSVLVELGFISNTREEMLLRDPKYQRKLALALVNGLQKYIKNLYPGSA
jgi:N-acetylmuramoyl-L-alanine amidase